MPFATNPELEKAVIADAENDLPRLVYADWLDENGDPARAAFIRVQCALWDKNPADADYPDLIELRREAFDGLRARQDLEPKLPAAVGFHGSLYDPDRDDTGRSHHRGFPFFAQEPYVEGGMNLENEAAYADRFAAALPKLIATTTLRGLNFYGHFSRQLPRILSANECGHLTALSAYNSGAVTVDAAVRSPMANSLQWLDLDLHGDADARLMATAKLPNLRRWEAHHGFGCTPAGLKKLASADWFGNLHRLLCPFPKAQAKTLWSALASAPNLHTIHVWGWGTVGGLSPLAATKPHTSLGRLHLHSTAVSGSDLNGLVRARLPNLAVLEVRGAMRNDDLKELITADWFAGLRVLKLDCGELGDQGVTKLGLTPAAANLRSLTLDTPRMGKKALTSIARDYPNLTTLNLGATLKKKVTPADMAAFAAALGLPNLRHLNLDGWPLDDAGAVALAKNPALGRLTRLSLDYTELGEKGISELLTSPHLQRLVFLSVQCQCGGDAIAALADPGVLPQLAHCWLPRNVSPAVFAKLVKARGNIFVGGPG